MRITTLSIICLWLSWLKEHEEVRGTGYTITIEEE